MYILSNDIFRVGIDHKLGSELPYQPTSLASRNTCFLNVLRAAVMYNELSTTSRALHWRWNSRHRMSNVVERTLMPNGDNAPGKISLKRGEQV